MTLLAHLVEASGRISGAAARSVKVRELADAIRVLQPGEIEIGVHYLSGEARQGRLGVGYALLKSLDVVAPAEAPGVSIEAVDEALSEIAQTRGARSNARRTAVLGALFARMTASERSFVMRILIGELRQGALAGVMIDAIAAAANVPLSAVRRAAMYAQNLGAVARVAMLEGVEALHQFQLEALSPVAPMLAQTAADVGEALAQFSGEAAFEWKMDGARIQVHKVNEIIRIYTRNLNDVTAALPEIVEAVDRLAVNEVILDGEAIALTDAGRPHPFQTTMRRFGRKLDVDSMRHELPIQAFFFDCLRLNGDSLADRPAKERFAALARAVQQGMRIPQVVTSSLEEAQSFQEAALAAGHEGVMAKSLDAPYEAGNRGASWLKIKRAHTLDLVVLAAEWGHGSRTGKLSNLHLGALDPATGGYVMLGKTFKGLTDATLEWQTQALLERETHRDQWTVYVRPELVVEIAFSDLQASPRYPGGLALRLARVKGYRTG